MCVVGASNDKKQANTVLNTCSLKAEPEFTPSTASCAASTPVVSQMTRSR